LPHSFPYEWTACKENNQHGELTIHSTARCNDAATLKQLSSIESEQKWRSHTDM